MWDLALIDAAVLLYVLLLVARSGSRKLGESLHDLIALLLIMGLFLGFRMAREIRGVLADMAELVQAIPGLGSRLLVIVGAWYLMRLIRQRSAFWIEQAIPGTRHKGLTRISEGVRAVLLAGFLVWLAEGLFDQPPARVPLAVDLVRHGEDWIERMLQPSPADASTASVSPGPPPGDMRNPAPGHPPQGYPAYPPHQAPLPPGPPPYPPWR
jgi:hypothetical protein